MSLVPKSVYALGLLVIALPVQSALAQPSIYGEWTDPAALHASGYSNDVQAIHSVLLPNGRVLCWGAVAFDTDPNTCEVLLFNPTNGSAIGVANKFGYLGDGDPDSTHGHDWFCAGHSHLPDGSVFLTAGGYTGGETSLY